MNNFIGSFVQTARYLLFPLAKVFAGLTTLLAPLLHLCSFLCHIFVFIPLSLVAKFETLYIFLGSAALVGILAGSVMHLAMTAIVALLSLDSDSVVDSRSSRFLSKQSKQVPAPKRELSPVLGSRLQPEWSVFLDTSSSNPKQKARQGLLAQTILEEDDSEDT